MVVYKKCSLLYLTLFGIHRKVNVQFLLSAQSRCFLVLKRFLKRKVRTNLKCTALLFFSTFLRQRCHIFIELFNIFWFVKCMKIRKLEIEIISILHNSLTQCTVEFLHYIIQGVLKLLPLKLVHTHLLNFSIVTKRISDWHHFCK